MPLSTLRKAKMEICSVNCKKWNNQWNKPEIDSTYLAYECSSRMGDLISFLPFFKKKVVLSFFLFR